MMVNSFQRRDYERRINQALDLIQRNLAENLSLEKLADAAAFSPFHFHRIFSALVGESVVSCIKRLRLERAARMLQVSPEKSVTEIALDCGFSGSAVFARSFRERFGVSATEWRNLDRKDCQTESNVGQTESNPGQAASPLLRYAPPQWVSSPTQNQKEETVEVKIENMPAIRAAYVRRFGSYAESSRQAWETLCRWAGPRGLLGPQSMLLGVSYDDPTITGPDRLRYDACIAVGPEFRPEGEIGLMEMPACRVAKARYEGSAEGISEAYRELYGKWLPESGFVPADRPGFDIYLNDPNLDGNYIMDICIPILPA